jgi:hypothetical protein
MRQPYGPGWEDPDWTPHWPPAADDPATDTRPRVSTLAEFMEVVKRNATPWAPRPALRVAPIDQRQPVAGTAAYVGQTRRWVIAGGAGLLAISTIPALPREARAANTAPDGTAPASAGSDATPAERRPGAGGRPKA